MAKKYLNDTDPIIFGSSWSFASGSVLSPAALTGTVNNYDPSGWRVSGVIKVVGLQIDCGGANRDITGLAAPTDGLVYMIFIVNKSTTRNLVLKNADAASTAANRFLFGANLTLTEGEGAWLYYSQSESRWRKISQ